MNTRLWLHRAGIVLATGAFVSACASSETGPSGQSRSINGLTNTGANLSGNTDMTWEVECTPVNASTAPCPTSGFQRAVRVLNPYFEWLPSPVGLSWIGVNERATLPAGIGDDHERYSYVYRMQFDLSGFDPSTVRLTLDWAADNYFGGYRLNTNTFVGAMSENRQWLTFKTLTLASPAVTFVQGRNLLEIRVIGDGQTDGLIVRNFQGTAVRR